MVIKYNHLKIDFYSMPQSAMTTLTSKELKETLLATDGRIIACGSSWDIISKHLGAGVHRVTLKPIVI